MFNQNEIAKIHEIFSRVVDCKGNLEVFKDFDWDKNKSKVIVYRKSLKDVSYDKIQDYKESKLEDYIDYKRANPNILDICNEVKNHDDSKNTKFDIRGIKNIDEIDRHFSILIKRLDLQPKDFDVLYTAFYDILKICGYKFDNTHGDKTILYLTLFQNIINYFKNKDIKFHINERFTEDNSNLGSVDKFNNENIIKALKECYIINKIICLFKQFLREKTFNISSGNGNVIGTSSLMDILMEEFKKFLDELLKKEELAEEMLKEILKALEENKNLKQFFISIFYFNQLIQDDSKNIIFYGAPGTGKTQFVKNYLNVLDPQRKNTAMIQFHPNYEYEDFIDGIKPVGFSNAGGVELEVVNGVFKEFCIKASKNPEEKFYFIVDEINRANLSAVFGETLSILEDSYRGESNAIEIKNSTLINKIIEKDSTKESLCIDYAKLQTKFYIPENIYFIGMMNDVDKSIDSFDLALRRRFTWVLMECDYDVIERAISKDYAEKCKKLNEYITKQDDKNTINGLNLGRAYEIGHSYFLKKQTMSEEIIWSKHIEPILREYIRTNFDDSVIDSKLKEARGLFV
ncbi:AAA family ATPase [Campylobacter sp. 9BO]|uniref:McrB family protein n=1 Tax=Campylobacter sp. 9BO TaxID=3424759 RepID=UPI003D32B568